MAARSTPRCPFCFVPLGADLSRMNIVVEACPQGHGFLLGPSELERHVSEPARNEIRRLIDVGPRSTRSCPSADGPLHAFVLDGVGAEGCATCTTLWFDLAALRRHVQMVRSHTFGAAGFPLRPEFDQGMSGFYPAEIIAGLLADFDLELANEGISSHSLMPNR